MLEWDWQVLDIGRLKSVASRCFQLRFLFCQAVKTVTAHFVLYLVFLGTVSDSKEISSSSVFGGRKQAVAILAIWQWLKFWIFLLLSHALSPVGRTAFWHPCPISESQNKTLHSIYCFPFASRWKYLRPMSMAFWHACPMNESHNNTFHSI